MAIEQIVQKSSFEILAKGQPALVAHLRRLLDQGMSPNQVIALTDQSCDQHGVEGSSVKHLIASAVQWMASEKGVKTHDA